MTDFSMQLQEADARAAELEAALRDLRSDFVVSVESAIRIEGETTIVATKVDMVMANGRYIPLTWPVPAVFLEHLRAADAALGESPP